MLDYDNRLESRFILGMRVDATSYRDAARRVTTWARQSESRYVCVAAVNNVMESHDSSLVLAAMNGSDLTTPDGMPLVWGLRLLGVVGQRRVYGPYLTPELLAAAERDALPVGFYGASESTLNMLVQTVRTQFPKLPVVYSCSPPYRPLSPEEDERVVENINASGARILFVGLNSPKQDLWMAAHRDRVRSVMVGVGAAFDFLSGAKPQAPRWMMKLGLEWLFRLVSEPRRLWRRYLHHNPRFVFCFGRQLLQNKIG